MFWGACHIATSKCRGPRRPTTGWPCPSPRSSSSAHPIFRALLRWAFSGARWPQSTRWSCLPVTQGSVQIPSSEGTLPSHHPPASHVVFAGLVFFLGLSLWESKHLLTACLPSMTQSRIFLPCLLCAQPKPRARHASHDRQQTSRLLLECEAGCKGSV